MCAQLINQNNIYNTLKETGKLCRDYKCILKRRFFKYFLFTDINDVYIVIRVPFVLLLVYVNGVCLTFLLVCVFLMRVRYFFEALIDINETYERNLISVVKATMRFNVPSVVVIAITVIFVVSL